MAADKTTDSTRVGLWVDPELLEAVQACRGELSVPQFFLKAAAKAAGLKKYVPRGRGYQGAKKTDGVG
jgi:hypothetical protein